MTINLKNLYYTEEERSAARRHDPALMTDDTDMSIEAVDRQIIHRINESMEEISRMVLFHEEICAKLYIKANKPGDLKISKRYKHTIRGLVTLWRAHEKLLWQITKAADKASEEV